MFPEGYLVESDLLDKSFAVSLRVMNPNCRTAYADASGLTLFYNFMVAQCFERQDVNRA